MSFERLITVLLSAAIAALIAVSVSGAEQSPPARSSAATGTKLDKRILQIVRKVGDRQRIEIREASQLEKDVANVRNEVLHIRDEQREVSRLASLADLQSRQVRDFALNKLDGRTWLIGTRVRRLEREIIGNRPTSDPFDGDSSFATSMRFMLYNACRYSGGGSSVCRFPTDGQPDKGPPGPVGP